MTRWSQEDVDRLNAERGVHRQKTTVLKTTHKYRAEPCIVTADLTLFTGKDLEQLDFARGRNDLGISHMPLKDRARLNGIDGDWFGSLKEGKRWIELKKLEALNQIGQLRRQVPYTLSVHGIVIGKWVADFVFGRFDLAEDDWEYRVEDCKGVKTELYRWKKKHVEAEYGITIVET